MAAAAIIALAATTFVRNRDYQSPVRLAQTAFERRPTDVARHFLGVALVQAGQRAEGIEHLERATATDPRAHYDLGMAYYDGNDMDAAIRELDMFVRREPALLDVVNARLTLARAFVTKRQWDEVIAQSREVLRMAPREAGAHALLGLAHFRKENYTEAIGEYRAYFRERPVTVETLGNLGISLVTTGSVPEAIDVFRQAVVLDPANPDAQRNLALAYFDHGDMALAAEHARRGLALRPGDAVMHNVLDDATAPSALRTPLAVRVLPAPKYSGS